MGKHALTDAPSRTLTDPGGAALPQTPEPPKTEQTLPSAIPGAAAVDAPAAIGDRYRIDRELGRAVAIKVLHGGARDEHKLRRFEQEARAAGSLNHPNIVGVFDIGVTESGPYIVCELLGGSTLRARLSGKPLPLRKAIDYALQLAKGARSRCRMTSVDRVSPERADDEAHPRGEHPEHQEGVEEARLLPVDGEAH